MNAFLFILSCLTSVLTFVHVGQIPVDLWVSRVMESGSPTVPGAERTQVRANPRLIAKLLLYPHPHMPSK